MTWEQLRKASPTLYLHNPNGDEGTDFWEDLYQLFKQRMEHEIRIGQMDITVEEV